MPKIESMPDSLTENHSQYRIEPLELGFGQTLGNSLRRVLLSSLQGAAITSIKIENVYHEFSAIQDIREDVTEFILNVKQVRLRSFSDRPVQCRLSAAGGGRVTAADIICPPDVEIVNPEQVLATLDGPDSRLTVEFTVEKGRGYIPADQREPAEIGAIPVDAIFTPMRKVNYQVDPLRIGPTAESERLVLDVWTDGTITPNDAVAQASQILIKHFDVLTELAATSNASLQRPSNAVIPPQIYDTPIEDLDLSVRAYNCLKRAGITRVGQVLEMTEEDLLGVRNFGRKSLDELRERLASRGLLDKSRLVVAEEALAEGEPEDMSEETEDEDELEASDEDLAEETAEEEDEDEEEGFVDEEAVEAKEEKVEEEPAPSTELRFDRSEYDDEDRPRRRR